MDIILPLSVIGTVILAFSQIGAYRISGMSPILDLVVSLIIPILLSGSNALALSAFLAGITLTALRIFWRYNFGYIRGYGKRARFFVPTKERINNHES